MHYARPSSMEDAISLLARSRGQCVCSGRRQRPAGADEGRLHRAGSDRRYQGDRRTRRDQGNAPTAFAIGAAVPCAVMGEAAALKKAWPGVVEAANLIGSKQVQGRCTIVGNLCNASPAADSVPALVAAGAKAVIAGPGGQAHDCRRGGADGAGQDVARQGRDHRGDPARQAPAAFGRRLSALHSAHGDGYRGGQRRCQPDARRRRCGDVGPRGVGRGGADGAAGGEAADAIVGTKLDAAALDKLAAACSAACRPIDDKRGTDRIQEEGCRRSGQARRADRL